MLTVKYAKSQDDGTLDYVVQMADEVREVSYPSGQIDVYLFRYPTGNLTSCQSTVETRIPLGDGVFKVFVENPSGKTVQCFKYSGEHK